MGSQVQHCAGQQSVCTCSEQAGYRSEEHSGKPCTGTQSLGKAAQWGAAVELFQSQFYAVYTF